jgi:hypothetical protein
MRQKYWIFFEKIIGFSRAREEIENQLATLQVDLKI